MFEEVPRKNKETERDKKNTYSKSSLQPDFKINPGKNSLVGNSNKYSSSSSTDRSRLGGAPQ